MVVQRYLLSRSLLHSSNEIIYSQKIPLNEVYGLSNAHLDTNWGKIERGKEIFRRIITMMGCRGYSHLAESTSDEIFSEKDGVKSLVNHLMNDDVETRAAVTGQSYKLEKSLAKIFIERIQINKKDCGTRSTTILTLRADAAEDDEINMFECSYDNTKFEFNLPSSTSKNYLQFVDGVAALRPSAHVARVQCPSPYSF